MKLINKHKQGQAEILGLVFIVAILAIGMIFVFKYLLVQDDTNINLEFNYVQRAKNTVGALLKTNTECRGIDYTELLKNCDSTQGAGFTARIMCSVNGETASSCDYLNYTTNYILNETLDKWNYKYYISIYRGTTTVKESELLTFGTQCPLAKKAEHWPIPTGSGHTLIFQLDLCK